MQTKKLALTSLLLAVALIIGVIENLIPPIFPFLPYVKIGFSNIVILVTVLLLDWKYAGIITVLKSIIVPLFIGNPMMIFYSLPASAVAFTVTCICLYSKKISIPSVSVLSAIAHNATQLCVACLMTNSLVFGFFPYFVIIGTLSGLGTGIIAYLFIKYIPKN